MLRLVFFVAVVATALSSAQELIELGCGERVVNASATDGRSFSIRKYVNVDENDAEKQVVLRVRLTAIADDDATSVEPAPRFAVGWSVRVHRDACSTATRHTASSVACLERQPNPYPEVRCDGSGAACEIRSPDDVVQQRYWSNYESYVLEYPLSAANGDYGSHFWYFSLYTEGECSTVDLRFADTAQEYRHTLNALVEFEVLREPSVSSLTCTSANDEVVTCAAARSVAASSLVPFVVTLACAALLLLA